MKKISVKLRSFQIEKIAFVCNARYCAIKGREMYERIARVR